MADKPMENNNNLILNQNPNLYVKLQSKLMDDTFTSLSKLFVYEMIKDMGKISYQSCGSLSKSSKTEQRKSTDATLYIARENDFFSSYVHFSKTFHKITYLPELNQTFWSRMNYFPSILMFNIH